MALGTLILILLLLMLVGATPVWRYNRGWGYGPSGVLGLMFVIVAVMFLMGRI